MERDDQELPGGQCSAMICVAESVFPEAPPGTMSNSFSLVAFQPAVRSLGPGAGSTHRSIPRPALPPWLPPGGQVLALDMSK
jgi:hypothetical protein